MSKEFLEAGKIVNTFGIRGELKIQPWSDEPDFLKQFKTVYIAGKAYAVKSVRVHQNHVLMMLEGVSDMDAAIPFKNKVVEIRREDITEMPFEHFIVDLVGLDAKNAETGELFGTVTDVLSYPAQDLYEVKGQGRTWLIPDADVFVQEINEEEGYISFFLMEGL